MWFSRIVLCVAKVQKFTVHVILNHELVICSLKTRAQKVTVSIDWQYVTRLWLNIFVTTNLVLISRSFKFCKLLCRKLKQHCIKYNYTETNSIKIYQSDIYTVPF